MNRRNFFRASVAALLGAPIAAHALIQPRPRWVSYACNPVSTCGTIYVNGEKIASITKVEFVNIQPVPIPANPEAIIHA